MKLRTKYSTYTLIENMGVLVNSEIEDDLKQLYQNDQGVNEERLPANLRAHLSYKEITKNVAGCRSLVLNITEECNFRCKYCSFSGKYHSTRSHGSQKMSLTTAN
ncbi:MAG: hypothetical protein GY765_04180 [bacterium]|nr:hypothetical protein [bacterium]